MSNARVRSFLGLLVIANAPVSLTACSDSPTGSGTSRSEVAQPLAPLSYVDQFGRTWIRSSAPVVYDTNTDATRHIENGSEPSSVTEIADMTLEEATQALRPKSLRGDWEYTLADADAREFASEVQKSGLINGLGKVEGETAQGVDNAPKQEGQPSAPTQIAGGSDDRFSIDSLKGNYPYNNVAVMSNAGTCTTFKLINHHTAVTAAHCVHSGSGWLTRKQITFRPLSTVGSTCYGMTVPGCWDGDNRQCDYATIKFREGTGYCDYSTYNVGYLGWTPTNWWDGTMYHSLWGYPSQQMKPGWSYPELVWDYNTMNAAVSGNNIHHYTDATPGQSGSPLFREGAYATGIWWGWYNGTSYNNATGMNSSVYSWLSSNSGW